ncbi:MAG: M56 family metallopeptidase [Actinomycetota bacterium]
MGLVLLVAGLGLLALPALTRQPARRLRPDAWARGSALTLAGGAVVFELAAVLHAAPTVLRTFGVSALASACERLVGPLAPGGPWTGWPATAIAVTVPVLGWVGLARVRAVRGATRIESWLGHHEPFAGHELVVLPTPEVLAVSVPGRPGQIVVSEGLVEALAPVELAVVLRHEAAHLDHRHERYLLLATALEHAFTFLPPVRRSTATLRTALERWADEEATGEDVSQREALRAALLSLSGALDAPELAAFSAAQTVFERVRAMASAPPRPSLLRRVAIYAPGFALGLAVLVATGAWAGEVRLVVAMAGRCAL